MTKDARSAILTARTLPETPHTLALQRAALVKGARRAMLYPTGVKAPEPPQGMYALKTTDGVFHYNPRLTNAAKIEDAVKRGRVNEVLGLGPYSKADVEARVKAGEPLLAVVARKGGHEAVSAAGTPSTVAEQRAELQKQGRVSVEPILGVLADRAKAARSAVRMARA